MIEQLQIPLEKEDVELRIGSTSQKGFSLLLYKTARTDVKRLNKVCGAYWKNRHFYDEKGNICCEISIYDKNIGEWISRSDVGVESFAEKEKGSYSDSFKRAGFRWGIGIELYSAPFIWINWDMQKNEYGKGYTPKNFYTSNLNISKYEVKDNIIYLEIKYGKDVIYSNFTKSKQNTTYIIQNKQTAKAKKQTLNEVLKEHNIQPKEFCNKYSIKTKDDADMLLQDYELLKTKIQEFKKETK